MLKPQNANVQIFGQLDSIWVFSKIDRQNIFYKYDLQILLQTTISKYFIPTHHILNLLSILIGMKKFMQNHNFIWS